MYLGFIIWSSLYYSMVTYPLSDRGTLSPSDTLNHYHASPSDFLDATSFLDSIISIQERNFGIVEINEYYDYNELLYAMQTDQIIIQWLANKNLKLDSKSTWLNFLTNKEIIELYYLLRQIA